jgi:creatinine amidohydrolase
MRTNKYQFMRPDEIRAAQKEKSIVYMPIGPLEWHGPAMPFGTDPLAAERAVEMIADKVGGIALPTLYIGTERERSPEIVEAMGFEDRNLYIIGQDVPTHDLHSFYFREEIFSLYIREYLRILVDQGFKMIVIINGHGATNQIAVLNRLKAEFEGEYDVHILNLMALAGPDDTEHLESHATKVETSIQMYLNEDNVDLSKLPPLTEKLRNSDWGINSNSTFNLCPTPDHTIEDSVDPRHATAEYGRRCVEAGVAKAIEVIESEWAKISK